ncbi:MAG: hypothetical protein Q7J12_08475 [Syntrophales bacterium]|nr:hypothetical protein [Syntrophales bacterium]
MKKLKTQGVRIIDALYNLPEKRKWTLQEKLLLGLTPQQYIAQADL